MQTISIPNFKLANIGEQSALDADVSSGTTLTVKYADNFSANNFIFIGTFGAEDGEVLKIQSVTQPSTITTVSAVTKAHNRYDKLVGLFGDQAKIYRAANVDGTVPADSSFSYLATVTLDYDQSQTTYTDGSGSNAYWYKCTYFNSVTSSETALADSAASRSVGNYCTIEDIRQEAGLLNNRNITDSVIDKKRQTAQQIINAALSGSYPIPFTEPINPLVADMTKVLAAGYLLVENYGPTSTLNTNQGQQKIDYILGANGKPGMLDKVNTGDFVLVDILGNNMNIGSPGIMGGYPNADTVSDVNGESESFGFYRSMRY